MVRDIKEKHGFAQDPPRPVLVEIPTDDGPREFDLTDPLREACRTIVAPIVEGIREVLRKVDPEYRDVLRRNILLAGGGSQLRGLDQAVEKQLATCGGGAVRRVHDSAYAGAAGALKLAMAMPAEKWDHIKSLGQLVPAA
jgi:rod shape-determining protein MreB